MAMPMTQKTIVAQALLENGPMTADEVAAKTDLDKIQVMRRMTELRDAGKVVDSGERKPTPANRASAVWRAIRAGSRAEGLENIRAVNGIQFYVTADAYRAAREEDPNWPRGSDAEWGRDAKIAAPEVSLLSQLWVSGKFDVSNFGSWAEARDAAYGTKTSATVDGEEVDAELLPPDPERWSSKRGRLLNEAAADLARTLHVILDNPLAPLKPFEAQIVHRKLKAAQEDLRSVLSLVRKRSR